MADIVPFGKYKGQPIEALQSDSQYCAWLSQQAWVVKRYPALHTLIINNFGELSETPEHNALQIRFLDEQLRLQCTMLVRAFFREMDSRVVPSHDSKIFHLPYLESITAPRFEERAIDVQWSARQWRLHGPYTQWRDHYGTRVPRTYDASLEISEFDIAVECKPLLGDDYPAVLRSLNSLRRMAFGSPHFVLVAGEVRSRTVSLADIKTFFALSRICLVLLSEIEAAEPFRLCAKEVLPTAQALYERIENQGA
jgi:hypothetical protein